jgi:KTSC domain-containing protein
MVRTPTGKRSTMFHEVAYDAASGSLELQFKSGGRWRYQGVSPVQHAAMLSAPSLGKWYNDNLWGQPKKHPAQKIAR